MTRFILSCKSAHYSCCICSTSLVLTCPMHVCFRSAYVKRRRNPPKKHCFFNAWKSIINLKIIPKVFFKSIPTCKLLGSIPDSKEQEIALADWPTVWIGLLQLHHSTLSFCYRQKQTKETKSTVSHLSKHCHGNNLLRCLLVQLHPQVLRWTSYCNRCNVTLVINYLYGGM